MRHDSLQRVVQTLLDQTQGLRASQQYHDAQLIEETALYLLVESIHDSDADFAWIRAMRKIIDLTQPLPCDTFAIEVMPLSAIRLEMLNNIPAIESIERPEHIDETIRMAIASGAPIYNRGDALRCTLLYWTVAQTLVSAPLTRGFAGQSRIINGLRKAVDAQPVRASTRAGTIDNYAWALRHALDSSLHAVQ